MTPPRWIIPLESGQVTEDGPRIEVVIVEMADGPHVDFATRNTLHERAPSLSPLAACQLGQALQDAAKWCGQERARREARKR